MRILFILLLAASLITGCHNNKPAHLLSEDTYTNLLVELQLLKTYQDQQHPGSYIVDSLRQAIFKKYGTTKEQFKESDTYYSRHIDKQNERIKEAIDRLRKDRISSQDSLKKSKNDSTVTDTTATDFVKWYFLPFNYPEIPAETPPGVSLQDSNYLKTPFTPAYTPTYHPLVRWPDTTEKHRRTDQPR
jgi:hypothetical protein